MHLKKRLNLYTVMDDKPELEIFKIEKIVGGHKGKCFFHKT